jgi:PAS domain S-box-containing protein
MSTSHVSPQPDVLPELALAAIDTLDQLIALIDGTGRVLYVNQAWSRLGQATGAYETDVGRNYLEICDAAEGEDAPHAQAAAAGLRAILSGAQTRLELNYPCPTPQGQGWFKLRATAFQLHGTTYALVSHEDVTTQVLNEESRRESEDRHRLIWEATNDAMALSDAKGTVLAVNPAYYRLYGGTPAEVIGTSFARIFPAEARAWAEQTYRKTFWTQPPGMLFESNVHSADGNDRVVESRIDFVERAGVRVGMLSVVRDITAHKQALARLSEQESLFRLIFERSPLGIALVGLDYRFLRVNERLCALTGYSADELLGLDFPAITHPDDLAADVDLAQQLATGAIDRYSIDKRYIRKDGEHIWVRLTGGLLRSPEGEAQYFLAMIKDITAQRREEEERLQAEQRLQETQRLESLGLLAGGIAHDFNNLLTVVIGNANLALEETPPAAPVRDNLVQLERAAQRAAELTRQMLAYAGRGRFVVEPIDLNRLIEESYELLHASLDKQISLKLALSAEGPTVEADATQLRQVLMNLVINAGEAIGERPGVVTLATRTIWADVEQLAPMNGGRDLPAGWYAEITVSDTGSGMDAATLQRIFEPFFTTKFDGRGLGLAAVQGIVRRHRGALTVASTPGQGTSFTVLLPTHLQQAAPGTPEARVQRDTLWSGTVLVIEDEPEVRKLLTRLLGRLGFEVICAEDGLAGVELLQANAAQVRCVLLDLTMPRLSGEETFRELRRIRVDVPVIIMSGYAEEEIAQRFGGGGGIMFLAKPFTRAALEEHLRAALAPES